MNLDARLFGDPEGAVFYAMLPSFWAIKQTQNPFLL